MIKLRGNTRSVWYNIGMGMRKQKKNHKERLEWLGDKVLDFVVSEILFDRYKDADEGKLTKMRRNFTSNEVLTQASIKLNLHENRKMSKKQIADLFEIEVAKIYFEDGLEAVKLFIETSLIKEFEKTTKHMHDYKSELQELLQRNGPVVISYNGYEIKQPKYENIKPDSNKYNNNNNNQTEKTNINNSNTPNSKPNINIKPDINVNNNQNIKSDINEKIFESIVFLAGQEIGRGYGTSKKEAESMAAKNAIDLRISKK
jgi:dsRNA-specific ribonuclease